MIEGRLQQIIVAAFVGLGGVFGFGVGNVAVGAQEQPNACDLFTRKEAKRIVGKTARRETNITGQQGAECSYAAEKDATRLVGLAVGEFASDDDASKAYTRARVNAKFDGLEVENVRKLGNRAHWLPKTNNFERTVLERKLVLGELTVLDGRRIYTAYLAPPSKAKARDTIDAVIAD